MLVREKFNHYVVWNTISAVLFGISIAISLVFLVLAFFEGGFPEILFYSGEASLFIVLFLPGSALFYGIYSFFAARRVTGSVQAAFHTLTAWFSVSLGIFLFWLIPIYSTLLAAVLLATTLILIPIFFLHQKRRTMADNMPSINNLTRIIVLVIIAVILSTLTLGIIHALFLDSIYALPNVSFQPEDAYDIVLSDYIDASPTYASLYGIAQIFWVLSISASVILLGYLEKIWYYNATKSASLVEE